jgi:hypothetical protein
VFGSVPVLMLTAIAKGDLRTVSQLWKTKGGCSSDLAY